MNTITLSLNNGLLNINSVCGYTALGTFKQMRVADQGAASIVICTNRAENTINIMHGGCGGGIMPMFDSKAVVNMDTISKAARANGYKGILTMLNGREVNYNIGA